MNKVALITGASKGIGAATAIRLASKGAIDTLTIGLANEVAAAIAWLVSDESSYTTGAFIDVSGGR